MGCLPRDRIRPGNHGLRGDERGQCGHEDERNRQASGNQHEERVAQRLRPVNEECALTQITQAERRKDDGEPRALNGLASKMGDVGVKRFRAGHRKDDCTQGDESG